jgi:hypothetical protein
MTMQFVNIVKAQITQTLLASLLERGNYRVTRLGIEELFGEIKYLDLQAYMALNLPLQLRYLPDLLVASREMKQVYMVEVKFRQRFDESSAKNLYEELSKQREYWPQSYAVVMVAEPQVPDGKFHQDYIRVVEPTRTDWLIDEKYPLARRWERLAQIYHAFKDLSETKLLYNADSITPALKELTKLTEKF